MAGSFAGEGADLGEPGDKIPSTRKPSLLDERDRCFGAPPLQLISDPREIHEILLISWPALGIA